MNLNVTNTLVRKEAMPILDTLAQKTYLTFKLDNEMFAVDVQNVHEVIKFTSVTKIPGVPPFVSGIINLRDMVVPVVDLRLKLNMSETTKSKKTCVIILDLGHGDGKTIIGALADSVHEVFEFESGQIEQPPHLKGMSRENYIQGVGKRDDQFVILLNMNQVFSSNEVIMLGAAIDEDLDETEEDNNTIH